MDGIAGIVYPDKFQMNELIHPMLNTIKHRCGKGHQVVTFQNVEVGSCGVHIGKNRKHTITAFLDGNIYNKSELIKELKGHGVPIESNQCVDLLVYAYEHWGNTFLEKLAGDFAIVILDQQQKKLLLARDRMGKKPLYWFQNHTHFIFASELKALLSTGVVPQTPAMDALSSYLYFGYIPQDMSPIEGISKLLPSHYLQFNLDGSKAILSYWSYSSYFEKQTKRNESQIIEHLDEILKESVQVRIPDTQPLGCFVSGGLGSASIAYYLKNLATQGQVSAFTVGFEGQNDQDIETAKTVTKALHLDHEIHCITQGNFLDDFVRVSWHLDEPLADPNSLATWKLAQLAKTKTEYVYSGMGSDELLAGHGRYTLQEHRIGLLSRISQPAINRLRQFLIPLLNILHKPLAYELVKQSRTNPWQFDYLGYTSLMDENEMRKASPKLAGIFDPEVFLHKFHHLNRVQSNVASYLYFDVKTRLADFYCLQYERLTAAHALSWRTPYLDRHIVEFVATLPGPEFLQESETFSYLKALLQDVFPDSVLQRPKQTRKDFLHDWIISEEMRELFGLLKEGTLVETGLISKTWLETEIQKGSSTYLWAILSLEIWFRLYINHPIATAPPNMTVKELLHES